MNMKCITHGTCIQFSVAKCNVRNHVGDLDVDGHLILKWALK
jgi:hypothetical protein